MAQIAIVNKETLNIESWYEADAPQQGRYGGPWGDPDKTVHLELQAEIEKGATKAEMVEESLVLVEDQILKQEIVDSRREAKLNDLRKIRDQKLLRVDVLVNLAVLYSWTASEKTELRTYRQALLDVTEDYKDNMSLLDDLDIQSIQWPQEPSEV